MENMCVQFLEAIWCILAILERVRGHLERSRAHLGAILGDPGPILGPSWAYLGLLLSPCWAVLDPFWGHVAPSPPYLDGILDHALPSPSYAHMKPASGLPPVCFSLSLRKLSACFRLVFISLSVSSQLLSRLSTLLSTRVRLALSKLSSLLACVQLELAVGLPSACFQFALSSRSAYPLQALFVAFNSRSDSHPCSHLVFSLL